MGRLFSPVVKSAHYIDLELGPLMDEWNIDAITEADILESGMNELMMNDL